MWLRWFGGVALFESVTQKGIRAAAAPVNAFATYCDRDDLNVCKRARENGDGANWKLEASLKCRSCRRGDARKQVSAGADAAPCADRWWKTAAQRVVTIAASIPEDAADSPASS